MVGIVPTSALTKFVKEHTDAWMLKAGSARDEMLKKIKPEELDYSGVSERLANMDDTTRLSKADLVDWDANRADKFSESQRTAESGTTSFNDTTISSSDSETYFENVRRYHPAEEENTDILGDIMDSFGDTPDLSGANTPARQVDSHFSRTEPDYLTHSRGTIEEIGGVKDTRLVQEIQSNLHKKGRQFGYKGETKWSAMLQDD